MKNIKRLSATITSLVVSMVFMAPLSAHAATDSYILNANYDVSTCTATINGNTGITNASVMQGDDVNITVNNQSSVPLNVVFAVSGGADSSYQTLYPSGTTPPPPAIGPTYTTTFSNLQKNVSVNITDNNGCGANNGLYEDATESITAQAPASSTPSSSPTTTTPKASSTGTSSNSASSATPSTGTATQVSTPNSPSSNSSPAIAFRGSQATTPLLDTSKTSDLVKAGAGLLVVIILIVALAVLGIWEAPKTWLTKLLKSFNKFKKPKTN